ncbi:MAG TPA: hypothetical protein PLJ47_09940 [Candidatus Hydrogenedentes bacterium]|nr:hypothetical protein [Candidatus Hydrogenedentota bacterium]
MDPLLNALRRLRMRLFVVQWARAVVLGLIVSTALACVWLMLARLFPSLGNIAPVSAGLILVALVLATAYAIWKRPSVLKAALEADQRLGLQERITSSLQLSKSDGPMVNAVHEDARKQLARLDYTREFPLTTPRAIRWLALPVALYLVAYLLLPEFDLFGQRAREVEANDKAEAVRVEAARIVEAVKPLKELTLDEASPAAGIAGAVERISEELKTGDITEKQAFARLTNLTDKLAEERKKVEANAPTPKLGDTISKLEKSKALAEDLEKGDYSSALERAEELAAKAESGEMSQEEKESLAKEMGDIAKALEESNPALSEALSKLASGMKLNNPGDMKAALEAMKLSLEELESIMAQLKKMSECEMKLGECKSKMYCPECGGMCKGGACMYSKMAGQGGTKAGYGTSKTPGERPDFSATQDPTKVSGEVTQGNILASILQRAAPTEGEEASIDYSAQALEQISQQREEALTKEEIPAGAREFVRQYFGSLEPEGAPAP